MTGCGQAGQRGDRRDHRRPRHDQVDGTFSVAYLVFNTIMNLTTQEAQVACFGNAAAHLSPAAASSSRSGSPSCAGSRLGRTSCRGR